jgi:hypothetical protein
LGSRIRVVGVSETHFHAISADIGLSVSLADFP